MAINDNPWFVIPVPRANATARVLCCPFAGSGATFFFQWAREFPEHIELVVVQLPGRETRFRETPLTSVSAVVLEINELVDPVFEKPVLFYGHSMGAKIMYELAKIRYCQGRMLPGHLIVSGSRAPHLPNRLGLIHSLPEDELIEKLKEYGGTPKQFFENQELLELYLPTIRADFQIDRSYIVDATVKIPVAITAFSGDDDRHASLDEMAAWNELSSNDVRLKIFNGDHFFINKHRTEIINQIVNLSTEDTVTEENVIAY